MIPLDQSALFTDLYQLTMLQAYHDAGMNDTAVFEFFVRKLPEERGFLIAAGLEQALDYLEQLHFSKPELDWLAETGRFQQSFLDELSRLRFTGEVHALPEGTIFFPNEPVLRVTAPLAEAQLVESRLINLLQFQTMIASKAARCVLAAPGKQLIDFGMRRAHGHEAGLLAARATYLAGFAGTATVQAGQHFGIPLAGTMAHSFIQAHEDESQAFIDFARSNPRSVVLLIDTYDTEAAAEKLVELLPTFREQHLPLHGVRIDSGDLVEHARNVRAILDRADLTDVTIFASGGLDEHDLARMTEIDAPIDGYGIGTRLDASADAPYLDCAYKLQEYAGTPRRKYSEGKATWPGRKQVFRQYHNDVMSGDFLTLEDDTPSGRPLLEQVMSGGQRMAPPPALEQIRQKVRAELAALPECLKKLKSPAQYAVTIGPRLHALAAQADERLPVTHQQAKPTTSRNCLDNQEIAQTFQQVADLLAGQDANNYRIQAYRRAAQTLLSLEVPVRTIIENDSVAGLLELPGIGKSLARAIEQLCRTGRLAILERLTGDSLEESILATVAGIGPELAQRIHDELGIETLGELETAAYDGRLQQVPGLGPKRLRAVRETLAGRSRQMPRRATTTSLPAPADQPTVAELLEIDDQYRRQAAADRLIRIAPRRFNPEHKAWLPILHTHREQRHYTALFSNSARAHEMQATHDWVVIYRDDAGGDGQWTIITAHRGPLSGRRIVRGREQECQAWYEEHGDAGSE